MARGQYEHWVCWPIPDVVTGLVRPKFLIMSLIYKPPGSKSCNQSTINYTKNSSVGTTVSSTRSTSFGSTVQVSFSGGLIDGGLNFDASRSSTDSHSMEVSRTETDQLLVKGACDYDGINHDDDEFKVFLEPALKLTIDGNKETFEFVDAGEPVNVRLGELLGKNVRASVREAFKRHNIDFNDKLNILAMHPEYWGGADNDIKTFDSDRFVFLRGIDYPTDNDLMESFSLSMSRAMTRTRTIERTLRLSFNYSGSREFLKTITGNVSHSLTWNWTYSNVDAVSHRRESTALLQLGEPSAEWGLDGMPTGFSVYYDTLFNTYYFRSPR